MSIIRIILISFLLLLGCERKRDTYTHGTKPKIETEAVPGDADECAFWIHPEESAKSLLIGNDKLQEGALYLFDMQGKSIFKTETIDQPVGVSVRYGISLGGEKIDVVACGVRSTNEMKVFKIDPETNTLIDVTSEKGISTGFSRSTYGLCLYKRPSDGKLFAFVSARRQEDIHQIELIDDGSGHFEGRVIRKFGKEDLTSFVEGMIADDALGFIYCSDEGASVLKYEADPALKDNTLLLEFAKNDNIRGDREGLGLYLKPEGKGYLVLSSQGNSTFKIYSREGDNAYLRTSVPEGVKFTDGIAVTSSPIEGLFPHGAIACHNHYGKNFVIYDWQEFSGFEPQKEKEQQPEKH